MPTQIEVPGEGILEFPDSMGDDEIRSVLRQKFPPPKRNAQGESKADLQRQMMDASIAGGQANALATAADIAGKIVYPLLETFRRADVTGISGNIAAREGIPPTPPLLSPEAIKEDVGTVANFVSQGLGLPVTAPPEGRVGQVLGGVGDFAAEMASSFTDPGVISPVGLERATAVGAADALRRAAAQQTQRDIARMFAAQMTAGVPQSVDAAMQANDLRSAVAGGLGVAANVALPLTLGRAAVEPVPQVPPIPDTPGRAIPTRPGAPAPRTEPAPIERVTPEQAAAQAQAMNRVADTGMDAVADKPQGSWADITQGLPTLADEMRAQQPVPTINVRDAFADMKFKVGEKFSLQDPNNPIEGTVIGVGDNFIVVDRPDFGPIKVVREKVDYDPDAKPKQYMEQVDKPQSPMQPDKPVTVEKVEPKAPSVGELSPDEAAKQGVNYADYRLAVEQAFRDEKISEAQFFERTEKADSKDWPKFKVGQDVYVSGQYRGPAKVTDVGSNWIEVQDPSGARSRQTNYVLEDLESYKKRHPEYFKPTPPRPTETATEKVEPSGIDVDLGDGIKAVIDPRAEDISYIDKDGGRVGVLQTESGPGGVIMVKNHTLGDAVRGKGYGGKAVLELSKATGKTIYSDENPSAAAAKMWERLGAKKQRVTVGEGDVAEQQWRYVLEPESKPKPVEKVEPPSYTSIRDAWDAYDGTGKISTARELADVIEGLDAPASVKRALAKYREAVKDDFENMAGRGDVEPIEQKFLSAVEKAASKSAKAEPAPVVEVPKPVEPVDVSPVVAAKTLPELHEATGSAVIKATTKEQIATIREASQKRKAELTKPVEKVEPKPLKMEDTLRESLQQQRDKVSEVRYGKHGEILFEYDGKTYSAKEPSDVMPAVDAKGTNAETSRSWALKQVLAGNATEVASKPTKPTRKPPAPAPKPETPAAAVKKVEQHVAEVKATEGTRPAKEVKSELVQRLEDALEKAQSENDFPLATKKFLDDARKEPQLNQNYQYGKKGDAQRAADLAAARAKLDKLATDAGFKKITIQIPGDGEFTLWNTKESISEVLDAARSIKTSPSEKSIPSKGPTRNDYNDALKVYGTAENAFIRLSQQLARAKELELDEAQVKRLEKLVKQLDDQRPITAINRKIEDLKNRLNQAQADTGKYEAELTKLRNMGKKKLTPSQDSNLRYMMGVSEKANKLVTDLRKELSDAYDAKSYLEQPKPAAQIPQGPGARTLEARAEAPESYEGTALKNAVAELERQWLGFPAATPAEKMQVAVAWVRAGREMELRPDAADVLVERITRNPNSGLSMDDSALLLREKVRLENEMNAAAERTIAETDPQAKADAQVAYDVASEKLLKLMDAVKERGSSWGREGVMRQILAREDYSLARMVTRRRMDLQGRELTPDEFAEVRRLSEELQQKQKAYEERIAELEAQLQAQAHGHILDQAKAAVERSKRNLTDAQGRTRVKENPEGFAESLGRAIAKRSAENKDVTWHIQRLARFFVEQGEKDAKRLAERVHEVVQQAVPEMTLRDTTDILSGYGKFTPISKDAVSVTVRDLKGQLQQIRKLEDMAEGSAPKKSGFERRTPSDEERRLIKQVEEKKREGGYNVTDPETQLRTALQAAKTRMANQIKDLEVEIAKREKIVKTKRQIVPDAELERLRNLRDELKEIHDEVFPKPELTEAERLQLWKDRVRERIAEYEDRVRVGNFKPKPKRPDPRKDSEAIHLEFELEKVHRALLDMRIKDRLSNLDTLGKAFDKTLNALRMSRAIMTGGEFSSVLRQGGINFLGHPIRGTMALRQMFQAFASEEKQFAIMKDIKTRENAPLYKQSKLEFTDFGTRLSTMEEHYMFRLSEKMRNMPGVKHLVGTLDRFQRAFTTYLNQIRADAFDAMVEGRAKDQVTIDAIADYINVTTGRGSTGLGAKVGAGMNTMFFAPRHAISRVQYLIGQPLWRGNAATRKMIAWEYLRTLGGAATMYALANMAGLKVGVNPTSTDFGKIIIGDTRIDPLMGLSQPMVLMSRLLKNKVTSINGRVSNVRGVVKFGQRDGSDLLQDFERSKYSPTLSMMHSFAAGKDPTGKDFGVNDAIAQSLFPMTYRDIIKLYREHDVPEATAMAILSFFGMGASTYDR